METGQAAKEFRGPLPSVADEFSKANLGHEQRRTRAMKIAEACSAAPDHSFPDIAGDTAALEGLYRFCSNDEVAPEKLVEAHAEKTCERAAQARLVVCPHDTTEFGFSPDTIRAGLGRLRTNTQGFLAHMTLAVAADGSRNPLGVLAMNPWVRPKGKKKRGSARERYETSESRRWGNQVDEVEARMAGRASLIHVMDREADAFPLLSDMAIKGRRFVVRLTHDRHVEFDGIATRLREAAASAPQLFEAVVPLSRRKGSKCPQTAKTHKPRDGRFAMLAFSSLKITIPRPASCPAYWANGAKQVELNVVRVHEPNPPEGEEPVEWLLATTEPVETAAQVRAVVDFYRIRWMIEEFFKAIKTGCAYEQRQLESYHALVCALAIFLPIAWQLLLLRHLARNAPEAPATSVLTPVQILILRNKAHVKLSESPTARQGLLAVASLGGHLKRNGEPGWLVLWRGMAKLDLLASGWAVRDAVEAGRT